MTSSHQSLERLRFYFSFRSPYAWLAFYRLSKIARHLPVAIDYIPLFPAMQFPGDPFANPRKTAYVHEDIERFTKAYGLTLAWPKPFDTDWQRPHASFLYALDQGRGVEFALAAYEARFSAGQNIATEETLAAVAEQCGLPADSIIRSADNEALQRRILKGFRCGQQDGLFGVPFFVYQGRRYWGNDRIEWLLRDVAAVSKRAAAKPLDDVFACPFE